MWHKMSWSKFKNIVLLILIGTNICLILFVLHRHILNEYAQRQIREQVQAFLSGNGISIDDEMIPSQMELKPQIVIRNREQERLWAENLLGGKIQEEARGGEIYRYQSPQGSLQFHEDGTFHGELNTNTYVATEGEIVSYSKDVLGQIGFEGEEVMVRSAAMGEELYTEITFCEEWNGIPIFNCNATLSYENGVLVGISEGRKLNGTPVEDTNQALISVPTALFRFYHGMTAMGDVCSQITEIVSGYQNTTSAGSGVCVLMPVWHITTDTGEYLLDTVTGELSRMEQRTPS